MVGAAAHRTDPSTQRQEFQDGMGGAGGDVSEKYPSLLVVLTQVPGGVLGASWNAKVGGLEPATPICGLESLRKGNRREEKLLPGPFRKSSGQTLHLQRLGGTLSTNCKWVFSLTYPRRESSAHPELDGLSDCDLDTDPRMGTLLLDSESKRSPQKGRNKTKIPCLKKKERKPGKAKSLK